jgi:hypothetical protein
LHLIESRASDFGKSCTKFNLRIPRKTLQILFEMLKISIYFFFIKISGSETGLFKIEK